MKKTKGKIKQCCKGLKEFYLMDVCPKHTMAWLEDRLDIKKCLKCEKEEALPGYDCCRECEEIYKLMEYRQNEPN